MNREMSYYKLDTPLAFQVVYGIHFKRKAIPITNGKKYDNSRGLGFIDKFHLDLDEYYSLT